MILPLLLGKSSQSAPPRLLLSLVGRVGPVWIEPTTKGLCGGSKLSDWSGGVGFMRDSLNPLASGVGLVCGMKRGMQTPASVRVGSTLAS